MGARVCTASICGSVPIVNGMAILQYSSNSDCTQDIADRPV